MQRIFRLGRREFGHIPDTEFIAYAERCGFSVLPYFTDSFDQKAFRLNGLPELEIDSMADLITLIRYFGPLRMDKDWIELFYTDEVTSDCYED